MWHHDLSCRGVATACTPSPSPPGWAVISTARGAAAVVASVDVVPPSCEMATTRPWSGGASWTSNASRAATSAPGEAAAVIAAQARAACSLVPQPVKSTGSPSRSASPSTSPSAAVPGAAATSRGSVASAAIISSMIHGGPGRSSGSYGSSTGACIRGSYRMRGLRSVCPVIDAAVDPRVFERHPDYVAVVVAAAGLVNGPSDQDSDGWLAAAERHVRARGLERAADDPRSPRGAPRSRPSGRSRSSYPCSAEALAQRVLKGGELPRINRLVDLYNAISVRHLIPVGGEDLDRLEGRSGSTLAAGDEHFDAPGGDEPPKPGEVVWRDDAGVTCRRWNWRQGTRTRLTEATTRAFFVFDRLGALAREELEAAVAELEAALGARELHRVTLAAPG